jgi:O-antigen/teichoic acid export membrane protein
VAVVDPGTARPDRGPGANLRGRAARGTVVNAAYLVFLNMLGFIKGFAVAAFLTASDYGVWGLLAAALVPLLALVQIGIDDKYIQQDEDDQVAAFQLAYTLQLMFSGVFVVIVFVAIPVYAALYGAWEILLPGWAIAAAMPAIALQSPLWTFYRRMDFVQQRKLQSFDPIVSLAVTIGLAAAGLGYWSLVVGMVAGSWAAAAAAMRASPFPLKLRYRAGTLREYAHFSGPLLLSAVAALLMVQVPVILAQRTLGLAAVGAIAIASVISTYANKVDEVVTETLYPAVCRVKDRRELLKESFLKSNRLALLWAMPTGVGIVLFGPDIVHHLLGSRWEIAIFTIQAFGLTAAINQVGFNWTAFFRAIGRTRPIAVGTLAMLAAVLAVAVPLLLLEGIDGYAVGMGISVLCLIAVRVGYLGGLFGVRDVLVNSARGMLPVVPGLLTVLALRLAMGGGERTLGHAAIEAFAFVAITAIVTLLSARSLFGEFRGYLRSGSSSFGAAAS